jgi:hypothetical protein
VKGQDEAVLLNQLLPYVRFPFIQSQQLVEDVERNPLVAKLELTNELLYEAYRYNFYRRLYNQVRSLSSLWVTPASLPVSPCLRTRTNPACSPAMVSSYIERTGLAEESEGSEASVAYRRRSGSLPRFR